MLAVQQEIALAAARQIRPQVDTKDMPRLEWRTSAYVLMLLARNYAQNAAAPKDWDKPVSLYRQVLDVDPESAQAQAWPSPGPSDPLREARPET